jgi:signal transduction histidine kinase
LGRCFGNLKIRPKLVILHNLFFLVLAAAVYFSLAPLLDQRAEPRARLTLLVVLGVVYVLAVLLLELVILPVYVYGRIRQFLEADEATRRGDHARELIGESLILDDEIGQIMRSRNATVAELRRHEEELRRKNQMLESQDRLVSLGMISASVAHEMNTPLAVLRGSIEKLLESASDPLLRERVERMSRVAERLQRISEGLTAFARLRKIEMGPVALRALIDESWHLVAIDEKAARVSFTNRIDAAHVAHGNADRLMQVFVNLLRNALDAVPPGGGIAVASRRVDDRIAVTVDDDGPGIAPELLPSIFDAFVTTRLDAKGTGLGLAVAEGIVDQHGGTIEASNRPEGGARLEVRLPASAGAAASSQQECP